MCLGNDEMCFKVASLYLLDATLDAELFESTLADMMASTKVKYNNSGNALPSGVLKKAILRT